jgi:hypothetical protein
MRVTVRRGRIIGRYCDVRHIKIGQELEIIKNYYIIK